MSKVDERALRHELKAIHGRERLAEFVWAISDLCGVDGCVLTEAEILAEMERASRRTLYLARTEAITHRLITRRRSGKSFRYAIHPRFSA